MGLEETGMMRIKTIAACMTALLVVVPTIAYAQTGERNPTTSDKAAIAIHNYGDTDRTCDRWTDDCRSCSRQADQYSCSNIGIACQPKEIRCIERVPSNDKAR
jgi:hypothetical protein